MLEKFMAAKQAEIATLKELAVRNALPPVWPRPRPSFRAALQRCAPIAVIAEYKRASPARGVINQHISAAKAGLLFKAAGAAAISVLTIKDYFDGDPAYLEHLAPPGLPLLRKDFIVDALQVHQTAATPASALLLIVRILQDTLGDLLERCRQQELEAVVEVFNESDLNMAQSCNSRIIQVNHRNLDTLGMDYSVTPRLIRHRQPHETWIAASGITRRQQIAELATAGYDAVLIGSAIMSNPDPLEYLKTLTSGRGSAHAD